MTPWWKLFDAWLLAPASHSFVLLVAVVLILSVTMTFPERWRKP